MTTHRVTITQLRRLAGTMELTTGHLYAANAGSKAYGRSWSLALVTGPERRERTILLAPSAAALFDKMHAYLDGYVAAFRQQQEDTTP